MQGSTKTPIVDPNATASTTPCYGVSNGPLGIDDSGKLVGATAATWQTSIRLGLITIPSADQDPS